MEKYKYREQRRTVRRGEGSRGGQEAEEDSGNRRTVRKGKEAEEDREQRSTESRGGGQGA